MRTLVVQMTAKPEPLITTTVQLTWSAATANADYQDTNTCRIAEPPIDAHTLVVPLWPVFFLVCRTQCLCVHASPMPLRDTPISLLMLRFWLAIFT